MIVLLVVLASAFMFLVGPDPIDRESPAEVCFVGEVPADGAAPAVLVDSRADIVVHQVLRTPGSTN